MERGNFMSATRNSTKATVKWARKTRHLFCNIAPNVLKGVLRVLPSTFEPGCCKLREYWLLIGQDYAGVTSYARFTPLAAREVCLGSIKRATCADFVAKIRSTLYFVQKRFATYYNLTCCETGLNVGGKTRNIAIRLILQQCCKTSCTFSLPVLPYL